MNNKKIARHAADFLGGKPEVFAYYNDDKTKTIDILSCTDGKSSNAALSTIGLSATDIGKILENDVPLHVELAMLGLPDDNRFGNILASSAFVIQESGDCDFGMIIHDVVTPYVQDTELQHVILLRPVFWDRYTPIETDEQVTAWLVALPITDMERKYILENGIEAFEKILTENAVNFVDLERPSCI